MNMKNDKIILHEIFKKRKIKSELFFSFLFFFVPSIVLYIILYFYNIGRGIIISRKLNFALLIALLWSFFGPYTTNLIFDKIDAIKKQIKDLDDESFSICTFEKSFVKYKVIVIIIALFLFFSRFFLFRSCPNCIKFIDSIKSNYITLIITTIYYFIICYLQAYGFAALILVYDVIVEVLSTKGLVKRMVTVNYSDGITPMGKLIMSVVVCCATGALYFPLYIFFASNYTVEHKRIILTIILLLVFILIIVLVYLYKLVKKSASSAKYVIVDQFYDIYDKKVEESLDNKYSNTIEGLRLEYQIKNVYQLCIDAEDINTKPIDLIELGTTAATVIAPIIVYLKDFWNYFIELINM